MQSALRFLWRVTKQRSVHVRLQHIAGKSNSIEDDIIRRRRTMARDRGMSIWGHAELPEPPHIGDKWEAEIVQTARASITRHTEYDQRLLTDTG